MLTFEEFKKLDIRIGKVISAERVPDSDKLVRLVFNFGDEERQIIAGIALAYPDSSVLVGKEMPVVVNLESKKMRGFESQGMILAADVDGVPVLLHPDKDVPPGSIVK
jgi:methionine--tRNA ligase beta chain